MSGKIAVMPRRPFMAHTLVAQGRLSNFIGVWRQVVAGTVAALAGAWLLRYVTKAGLFASVHVSATPCATIALVPKHPRFMDGAQRKRAEIPTS